MSVQEKARLEAALERCPECGLAPGEGRYGWGGGAPGARAERCATCGQVHDLPAEAAMVLAGPGYEKRRREILERVTAWSKLLAKEHPERRITAIEPLHAGALLRINDPRLALEIGDALVRCFGGSLSRRHAPAGKLLHVDWTLRGI